MSDQEPTMDTETAGGKGGAWTDGEKYMLLIKIIGQLTADGKVAVKLADIDMPGRTTKSLTHTWQKIRAEAAAGGSTAATKKITKTPATLRKRAAAKMDEDGNPITPTPRKRAANKAAPVKSEDEFED